MSKTNWTPPLIERLDEDLQQIVAEFTGMRPWSPYYPMAMEMVGDVREEQGRRYQERKARFERLEIPKLG